MLGGLGPTVVPRSCLSILEQQAQDQLVQGRQQDPAQPWETDGDWHSSARAQARSSYQAIRIPCKGEEIEAVKAQWKA